MMLFEFHVNFVICDEDVWLCEKFLILKTQPEMVRGEIAKCHEYNAIQYKNRKHRDEATVKYFS